MVVGVVNYISGLISHLSFGLELISPTPNYRPSHRTYADLKVMDVAGEEFLHEGEFSHGIMRMRKKIRLVPPTNSLQGAQE